LFLSIQSISQFLWVHKLINRTCWINWCLLYNYFWVKCILIYLTVRYSKGHGWLSHFLVLFTFFSRYLSHQMVEFGIINGDFLNKSDQPFPFLIQCIIYLKLTGCIKNTWKWLVHSPIIQTMTSKNIIMHISTCYDLHKLLHLSLDMWHSPWD